MVRCSVTTWRSFVRSSSRAHFWVFSIVRKQSRRAGISKKLFKSSKNVLVSKFCSLIQKMFAFLKMFDEFKKTFVFLKNCSNFKTTSCFHFFHKIQKLIENLKMFPIFNFVRGLKNCSHISTVVLRRASYWQAWWVGVFRFCFCFRFFFFPYTMRSWTSARCSCFWFD